MSKRGVEIIPYRFDAPCDMAFCSSPAKYAITAKGGPPSLFFKVCKECMEGLRKALLGTDVSGAGLEEASKLIDLPDEERILALARAKAAAADADAADKEQEAKVADELRAAVIGFAEKHGIDLDSPAPENEPKPEQESGPEETFKYHCKYCGMGFNSAGKLGAHVRRCPEK